MSQLVAWGDTWTLQRLHRQSNSSRMAHQYMPLPEGMLCLLLLSQEHGGDSRQAVTLGELYRAAGGPKPINRTGICSFVQGGTGWTLPEPYKMTSSRPLVWMSLTKQSETEISWGWPEGLMSFSGSRAHCPALWSSIGIYHWTPELADPPLAPCAFHRWEQVHPEHMWQTW